MWHAALLRFIRRRLVLGIIFACSLTYCVVSLLKQNGHRRSSYQDITIERKLFVWRTLQEHINDTIDITCRNSVQGKIHIVDDRGYICDRGGVLKNGCCDLDSEKTRRYYCETCDTSHCCVLYEDCVSCCLDPGKRDMLQVVLSKLTADDNVVFRSLSDDYELCLVKCRTSSHSVLHENSYRDSTLKHCFGDETPGTPLPD